MSYQVLARKWRPRTFTEMVGQEHVLRALINGLDNDRLHHAYLFTGTRGVGKTTLARILAKCLNCEQGVSSTPCNQCGSCREIAEGRFVDLIEVDAASRTKVEDTRELLDNVQYAPSRGRYKVYLIDEVHMLSTHSFNALLKTLEEPPPHVKFLLATTDPHKLPVTILSRCLQFNLKNLNPERIVGHLKYVLGEEKIPFEESALWELGRAADGSMRDALSLTDQAIAHGGGTLTTAEVNAMLGTIDRSSVVEICLAVAEGDTRRAMAAVDHMADHAPDYSAALAEMLSIWHQVAIAQTVPDALDPVQEHHQAVLRLAASVSREDIQLLYQITLLGRKDLPFAADPRSGFEMVLLRLLTFRPVTPDQVERQPAGDNARPVRQPVAPATEVAPTLKKSDVEMAAPSVEMAAPGESANEAQVSSVIPDIVGINARRQQSAAADAVAPVVARTADNSQRGYVETARSDVVKADIAKAESSNVTPIRPLAVLRTDPVVKPPVEEEPPFADGEWDQVNLSDYESYSSDSSLAEPSVESAALSPAPPAPGAEAASGAITRGEPAPRERIPYDSLSQHNWQTVCDSLGLGGLLHNTAVNLVLEAVEGNSLLFVLDANNSALYDESQQTRLGEALSAYFQCNLSVAIRVAAIQGESPRMIAERLRAERLQSAIDSLQADPNVQAMNRIFGAELVVASVKPID